MRPIDLIIPLIMTIPIGAVLGIALSRGTPKVARSLRSPRNQIWAVIIAVSVIAVLVLIDIYGPIWGGQIKFYAKWIECGQLPQQEPVTWGPQYISYYEQASSFSVLRYNRTEYFCTPKEAEMNGLSSNSNQYDYPHLTQKEYDQMTHRSENQ